MASKGLSTASGALSGAAAGASLGPWGAAIGGVVGGLAGLLGGGGDDDGKKAMEKAINTLRETGQPPDLSDPLVLKGFTQAGFFTPENIEKLGLNADTQQKIVEASEGQKNQSYALNALKDMSETGLTAADRAAYNQLRSQTAADTQAKTNQILQQQQMRGQASGGNALAAQLSAIQGSDQNASQEADRLAAAATQARAGALNNMANLAGTVRGEDFGTQRYNMDNELARQRFLDQNSMSRQTANVNMANQANQMNTQRGWATADRNTAAQNAELQRQLDAKQQYWDSKLKQAGMIAGALTNQSTQLNNQAANQASNTAGMITSGLAAVGDIAGKLKGPSAGPRDNHIGFGTGGSVNNADDQTEALNKMATAASGGMIAHDPSSHRIGEVPTDSKENDVVPVALSPGEIVIPRSFAHDPDLSKAYINFIHKHKKSKF